MFAFPDGDEFLIHAKELPGSGLRFSDRGHTLMRLSYDMDVDQLRSGKRGRLFESILANREADGVLQLDVPLDQATEGLFRFGQALTQLHDLSFLEQSRAEFTFYSDLRSLLDSIVPASLVQPDFVVPQIEHGEDYPIDFRIEGKLDPLFLFGIPGRDKARLVTIVLEHLLRASVPFESLLVFANQEELPRRDLARLSNVGGEMVASLGAMDDLRRKLSRRVPALA